MRIVLFFSIISTFMFATFNISFAQSKDIPYVFTNNAFSWYQYCESFLRESPIELHSKIIRDMEVNINSIKLDYRAINLKKIVYSQNSLEFQPLGNYELEIDGTEYTLQKYYFISNSAFTVLGKQYLLETHFLYQSKLSSGITKKPNYLVLVVFFDLGDQDIFIKDLVKNIPKNTHSPKTLSLDSKINYITLDTDQNIIPDNIKDYVYFEDKNHYNTFCPTGVSFLVLKDVLTISQSDSDILNSLVGEPQFSTNRIKNILNKKMNSQMDGEENNNIPVVSLMLKDSERLKIDPEYLNEQEFLKEISNLDENTKIIDATCPKEDDKSVIEPLSDEKNKEKIADVSTTEQSSTDKVVPNPNINEQELKKPSENEKTEQNPTNNPLPESKSEKVNVGTLEKKYNESDLLLKDFEDSDDTSDLY